MHENQSALTLCMGDACDLEIVLLLLLLRTLAVRVGFVP
jgi:hypothetical protein